MGFKRARLSASLTQKDAAEKLKVNRSTIAMWETGAAMPRSNRLPLIAKTYNCTVDELLKE